MLRGLAAVKAVAAAVPVVEREEMAAREELGNLDFPAGVAVLDSVAAAVVVVPVAEPAAVLEELVVPVGDQGCQDKAVREVEAVLDSVVALAVVPVGDLGYQDKAVLEAKAEALGSAAAVVVPVDSAAAGQEELVARADRVAAPVKAGKPPKRFVSVSFARCSAKHCAAESRSRAVSRSYPTCGDASTSVAAAKH